MHYNIFQTKSCLSKKHNVGAIQRTNSLPTHNIVFFKNNVQREY